MEIGANSYYIQWDDTSFLIDAGGHPDAPGYLSLPDFYRIQKLDFILVTHAHQDHIGSLPYLHKFFPDCPVYMTEETLSIAKIMLYDSLKFIRASRSVEGFMMYTRADVESLLISVHTVSNPFEKYGIKITPYSSGHILGSVGFLIEKNGKKVVFTSDTSSEIKATSKNIDLPEIRADLLIAESTYGRFAGSPSLPERNLQYEELTQCVKKIIAKGGSVLFPAFVIERAQEILLILNRAVQNGEIPDVPIFLAGLAIPITELHKKYLKLEFHYETISREEMEFLNSEEDGPYILITGSGMMNAGSSSSFHAEHLLTNPENAVIFTGYSAPGTAGFRLLQNQSDRFYINGHIIPARAKMIQQFHISCHAGGKELVEIISHFQPTNTILIHGDSGSVENLKSHLSSAGLENIFTPENNETVYFGSAVSTLGESVKERKKRFYQCMESGDMYSCRKISLSILEDSPWDIEMLEILMKISEPSQRSYYERKLYLILKLLCEKEMLEGNLTLAEQYLSLMGELFENRYIERNLLRIKKLKKKLALKSEGISKSAFYETNQDYKYYRAGNRNNDFTQKAVIGNSNQSE